MDLTRLKNKVSMEPDLVAFFTYVETLEARLRALEAINGTLLDMASLQRTRTDILEQGQHNRVSNESLLEAAKIAARGLGNG